MALISTARNIHLFKRGQFIPIISGLRMKATSAEEACPAANIHNSRITKAKPYSEIPGPRGLYNIPFIGLMFYMKPFGKYTMDSASKIFDDFADLYGPLYRIQMSEPSVIVSDPNDIATVYRNEGKYPNRPNLKIFDIYIKRQGRQPDLTSRQGKEWLQLRSPLTKQLNRSSTIIQYIPGMDEVADDFIKLVSNGNYGNRTTQELFTSFSAENVGLFMFNTRFGFLEPQMTEDATILFNKTTNMFRLVQKTEFGPWFLHKWFRTNDYLQLEDAKNYIQDLTAKHMKHTKDELDRKKREGTFDPDEPNVLLSLLNDDSLTQDEVVLIMEGMYTGGIESTAGSLQALFYNMARNPDKQEIARREIHDVMGLDNPITKEALSNMPYLKACIKENFRYSYPLPLGNYRKLEKDIVLSGYTVPAGVVIYTNNRKPCLYGFDRSNEFIPERWLRENIDTSNPSYLWGTLPFSYGPRSCLGKRIAEHEMHVLFAKVLQKLRVGVKKDSEDIEFTYSTFITPNKEINFTFTPI